MDDKEFAEILKEAGLPENYKQIVDSSPRLRSDLVSEMPEVLRRSPQRAPLGKISPMLVPTDGNPHQVRINLSRAPKISITGDKINMAEMVLGDTLGGKSRYYNNLRDIHLLDSWKQLTQDEVTRWPTFKLDNGVHGFVATARTPEQLRAVSAIPQYHRIYLKTPDKMGLIRGYPLDETILHELGHTRQYLNSPILDKLGPYETIVQAASPKTAVTAMGNTKNYIGPYRNSTLEAFAELFQHAKRNTPEFRAMPSTLRALGKAILGAGPQMTPFLEDIIQAAQEDRFRKGGGA